MPISIPTALLVGGGLAAAGGVASAAIGSSAATSAATTQANTAEYAANLQNQQFQQTQQNIAPYIQTGTQTLAQLQAGLQPGGIFNTPNPAGTFTPPTFDPSNPNNLPGYQFAVQQGDLGIEQGAAAAGGAFNSGTLKSLANYNTGLAQQYYTTDYQQQYNNALNSYLTQFNSANTQQSNLYNRLAGIAGTGQTAVTQLGQVGQQTAAGIGNTLTSGAAATAAGQVGSANAITSGLTGVTNNVSGLLTLSQLLNNQNSTNLSSYGASIQNGVPTLNGGQTYNVPYQPPVDTTGGAL